jgi:uncharacterized protein YbaA (DUF1428 family)
MSQYIDLYVVSIPRAKLAAYKKVITKAAPIWREHGALDYQECVGDDMDVHGMIPFPKLMKSKPGEIVTFAYVRFKSRKHRDTVNKRIMGDPRFGAIFASGSAIFDSKSMAYGGFTILTKF